MEKNLINKALRFLEESKNLERDIVNKTALYNSQAEKLQQVVDEQSRVIKSLQAIKDVRPLLSVSAIEKAEKLADAALAAIFDFPAKLVYSEEDGRFFVSTPKGEADLQEGSGGGLQAVVSFVFTVFLLMKEEARLFIALDEAFTQLDDDALVRFIDFLNVMCADLKMDILLVSHDARISQDQVNHMYRIEEGKSFKIK